MSLGRFSRTALVVAFVALAGVALRLESPETASAPGFSAPTASRRLDRPGAVISLGRAMRQGLEVEGRLVSVDPSMPAEAREGRDVRFEFSVVDTSGKTPVTKLYPSAWVVARAEGSGPSTPKDAARLAANLIRGSIFNPPDLDLNVYYVVMLNHDNTLSVVDPRFGFGGSKLLAVVPLDGRGDDWVLGPDGRRIFVAMPEVNRVAVVDTTTWKVVANVPGGVRPNRLALSPDGRRLWVAGGAAGQEDSGVTVIDTQQNQVVARIRTGRGRHDLTFSDDGQYALVSNSDEGTVSVLDADAMRELAVVRTGRRPYSIDFSSKAGLAYVTDDLDGTITAIDPATRRAVARINAEPGVAQIRFAPDGRAGFVVNTERNTVQVIDAAINRIGQTAHVENGPDQIAFSGEFAYIRHRGSVSIVMISLKTAGRAGAPLSTVSFPAGSSSPGSIDAPTPARGMIAAPDAPAMLVANAKDRSIYYYKEGLSAPMGTFNNYKREPRAVLVIDRSLGERTRPGVYESTVRLDQPGKFDVVFFVDQPRIIHCFPLDVTADPALELARDHAKIDVKLLVAVPRIQVGDDFRPLYELDSGGGNGPKQNLPDVEILMYAAGGGWQHRQAAREIAPGIYGADFRPDQPGVYTVCVACESIGLSINNPHQSIVHVEGAAAPTSVAEPRSQPR
jgi:YVTN family beta-propeller protein